MTTSCSNFVVVHKTLGYKYKFIFALHVYRTLWSWGDAHSADIHSLFYTFRTYQEPFQIKLYFSFTAEFHGLTFPFLGQVSASVLHMSFMTRPFHFQEGFQAELYFSLAEELSDQLCSMPNMAGEVVIDDRIKYSIGRRVYEASRLGYPYIVILGKKVCVCMCVCVGAVCVCVCVCVCLCALLCWSLLYHGILCFIADSLRSHVILHEWVAFYSMLFKIPPKVVYLHSAGMAGATWNCCHLSAFCVHYRTMLCTLSLYAKPHM